MSTLIGAAKSSMVHEQQHTTWSTGVTTVNRYPSQDVFGITVNDEQRVFCSGLVKHSTHGFVRLDDYDHRLEP